MWCRNADNLVATIGYNIGRSVEPWVPTIIGRSGPLRPFAVLLKVGWQGHKLPTTVWSSYIPEGLINCVQIRNYDHIVFGYVVAD